MNNVIPLPVTPEGVRALREARGHRKRHVIWLLAHMGSHCSEYTRRQALAVLSALRSGQQPTLDGTRWLNVMSASFDAQSREAARMLREEFASRTNV